MKPLPKNLRKQLKLLKTKTDNIMDTNQTLSEAEKIRVILDKLTSDLVEHRGYLFQFVQSIQPEKYPEYDNWDRDAGECVDRYMHDLVQSILEIKNQNQEIMKNEKRQTRKLLENLIKNNPNLFLHDVIIDKNKNKWVIENIRGHEYGDKIKIIGITAHQNIGQGFEILIDYGSGGVLDYIVI